MSIYASSKLRGMTSVWNGHTTPKEGIDPGNVVLIRNAIYIPAIDLRPALGLAGLKSTGA